MLQYKFPMTEYISIHALVKRATFYTVFKMTPDLISIHALVKRATIDDGIVEVAVDDFNPRPREEGDALNNIFKCCTCHFNPRPREEGDAEDFGKSRSEWEFQSTPS